jgi:hypothetical protein
MAPAAAKDVAHHLELIHKERVKEQQISRDKRSRARVGEITKEKG